MGARRWKNTWRRAACHNLSRPRRAAMRCAEGASSTKAWCNWHAMTAASVDVSRTMCLGKRICAGFSHIMNEHDYRRIALVPHR